MAIVSTGFEGYVSLVDTEGSVVTLRYDLQNPADFAAATTSMGLIITALTAVTDAVIKSWGVGEKYANNALTLPAAGVEVERRAVLSALIAGSLPQKWVNVVIPAPKVGLFMQPTGPGARQIDPNDAAVIDYLQLFETASQAFVSDGEVLADPTVAGNFSGRKTHRGSRNG